MAVLGYWACPVHYFTPAVNVPLLYAGLSLDEEVPDYDLDSEDEEWLSLQTDEKVVDLSHVASLICTHTYTS